MKKAHLLLVFAVLTITKTFSQQSDIPKPPPEYPGTSKTKVKTIVEQEAQFPGGDIAWNNFIASNLNLEAAGRNIKFPKQKKGVTITIMVRFVIGKDSAITNIDIENKDADSNCIAEVIRVLKLSPKWIPALQNGRVVYALRRQPIAFYFER